MSAGCDGNPVREDLTEAGEMVGVDFAVNFVLDADKQAVEVAAGRPAAVLESCAATCARVYGVAIEEKFDIVVASCGGYPKDICLYQAQKGLNLASHALKPGGRILLLAASPQGVGDDIYFDYVSQFTSPEEVIRDFKATGFRMGAHKAYLFGRTLVNYDVAVFSDLDPGILRKCHLRAAEPESVITEWVADFTAPRAWPSFPTRTRPISTPNLNPERRTRMIQFSFTKKQTTSVSPRSTSRRGRRPRALHGLPEEDADQGPAGHPPRAQDRPGGLQKGRLRDQIRP
jgi:hypothetical protein